MADELKDGLNIPVKVQTTGDAGKGAAEGIAKVREETQKATAVIRDHANAVQEESKSVEELAQRQRELSDASRAAGSSALASDPGTFRDAETEAAAAAEAEKEAKRTAAIERQNALISQRVAIEEAENELLAKKVAGDLAAAQAIEIEVQERKEALAIQLRTGIAEEEAMAMARQRVADERRIVELKAEQAAQAKAAALAEREQATASRIHGRGGEMGNLLQDAGVDRNAAVGVGMTALAMQQLVSTAHEVAQAFDEERIAAEKQSRELANQAAEYSRLAVAAQTLGDIGKLQDAMATKMIGLQDKLATLPNVAAGNWDFAADSIKRLNALSSEWLGVLNEATIVPTLNRIVTGWTGAELSTDKAKAKLQQYIDTLREADKVAEGAAVRAQQEWQKLMAMPVDQRIEAMTVKLEALKAQLGGIDKFTNPQQWLTLKVQVDQYAKGIEDAGAQMTKLGEDANRTVDKVRESMEKALPLPEQLTGLMGKIEELKDGLAQMGLEASSPEEALAEMGNVTVENRVEVARIAEEWQKVLGEIQKVTAAEQANHAQEEQLSRQAAAAAEKVAKSRDEALAKAHEEQELLRAKLSGSAAEVKAAESELQYQREIEALKKAGLSDSEAAAEAKVTKELRDQVDAMKEKRQLEEMSAQDAVASAEAAHHKTAAVRAEAELARVKARNEGLDAGMSKEDADARGDAAAQRVRREHHLIGGGDAKRSSRDSQNPDDRSNLDNLNGPGSDDFQKAFGKKKGSVPAPGAGPSDTDPGVFDEDAGGTVSRQQAAADKMKDAGAAAKEAANGMKESADSISNSMTVMKGVSDALGQTGDKVDEMGQAMLDAVGGLNSQVDDIRTQLSNLQTFQGTGQ